MFGKESRGEAGVTLVATNCELVGDIHFSDQLLINGIVKGNIYAQAGSKAIVTVSEKGRVKGKIRVPNVIVNGKVFGDINSDRHVELAAKADVKGNVYYNLIEMVMGSRVDGHLVHMRDGKKGAKAVEEKAGDKSDQSVEHPNETIKTPQVAAVSSAVK
ncbi:MAG TPA: cell shape determination protein CcmA [Gammaproteobacteria bacterium]|nr:cell shape determination protein CcmA [Gammaproteobacteria bacterium]|tara:strand:- start:194 stop:670 length:477 start_codon:yes stop_codon:yes gene_type:complete